MSIVYLSQQGTHVHKESQRLIVKKGADTVEQIRTFRLEQLVVIGNITLTTPAIHLLLDEGIETIFVTVRGRYRGRLQPVESKNIPLRQHQFRRGDDPEFKLHVAKQIVRGKLMNLRLLLMRHRRRRGMDELTTMIHRLRESAERVNACSRLDELRGVEGSATRAYFTGFRSLFTNGMGFRERNRRPPKDPVNALLSFGYTLLASSVQSAVHIAGLDPYLGYFHEIHYGRPSLVLDLMEEFRPIIVDSLVLYLVNRRMITEEHFEIQPDAARPVLLNEEGRRVWLTRFQQRLDTEASYTRTEQVLPYRRCFEMQARLMAKVIESDGVQYEPMTLIR